MKEQEKKLFLLDAYALIFRAYYAFISNPMTNSKGLPTSTIFGFTLVLEEILRKENPSHLAVVFDPPGPTFRNDIFPEYKANRDATPEGIKEAVPYIKKLIEGFNIPILEVAGYEADDVIGTMAKHAENDGFTVYMMTPDKDFAQLVSENIFMYKPGRGGNPPEILGEQEVREKFLVEQPIQVIDILALWGDTSDNIPGAPGIGEKTAKKLIGLYNSIEGIYEHIEDLKGKQKENLINFRAQVELSRTLATIALDVPVQISADELVRQKMDFNSLKNLFNELEFKTLANRILSGQGESAPEGTTAPADSNSATGSEPGNQGLLFGSAEAPDQPVILENFQTISTVKHKYELIADLQGVQKLTGLLLEQEEFCFDTETTSLDVIEAELVGIAFSWKAHEAYYVAFSEDKEEQQNWIEVLSGPFSHEGIRKIGQNLKYDLHILMNYGLEVKGELFDTMVAHFILKPEMKHNLNILAEHYLDYSMVKIEDLIGKKGTTQNSFRSVDPKEAKEYAGEDADITYQLAGILRSDLEKQGLNKLAGEIEMPLVSVLMKMEHKGVKLDVKALGLFAEELRTQIIESEKNIHEEAGLEFNISSPKQLGEVLFDRMKIVADAKKTKSKQYATGEEVLIRMLDKHPIVSKVLEYRSLRKLLSTYVEALPKLVKPKSGRIHTSFNQAQVTTGRLSSNNPNLQNIPIREERGREIRRAFIPGDPQYLFLSADYSQIELRLMAHLSGDGQMIEAFVNNEDIHTATAAKIYKVKKKEVSREMRSKAKTANFGIIYGISAFGLSQRMHIPRSEARQLIDGYFETYPGIRSYMDDCIRLAREQGYVETMYGRRRFLPDILSRNAVVRGNAERNAINSPIQGSAADVIKIAMVRIQAAMDKEMLQSSMILQVHDELNFEVLPEELDRMKRIVKSEMENATSLKVPLTVDMGSGTNWLEAH